MDSSAIYSKLIPSLSNFILAKESKEYNACSFLFKDKQCFGRLAKQTPKKIGQFVTFWKRESYKEIEPYHEKDSVDYLLVIVQKGKQEGIFVFPKTELIKRNILSTDTKEGKRGFRVYSSWDTPKNNQALRTQRWQLNYFHLIDDSFKLEDLILRKEVPFQP